VKPIEVLRDILEMFGSLPFLRDLPLVNRLGECDHSADRRDHGQQHVNDPLGLLTHLLALRWNAAFSTVPTYRPARAQPGALLHALPFGMQALPQGLLFEQVLQHEPPEEPEELEPDELSPDTRSNVPSPLVTSTTSPSRAVDQMLSFAGTSTQFAGVL
jgi:hypothetical protein